MESARAGQEGTDREEVYSGLFLLHFLQPNLFFFLFPFFFFCYCYCFVLGRHFVFLRLLITVLSLWSGDITEATVPSAPILWLRLF